MDRWRKGSLENRQRAWGIKAARVWLLSHGYMEMTADLDGDVPSLLAVNESMEVRIDVIAQATLFAAASKNAMYSMAEWRHEKANDRSSLVLVPKGFVDSANEVLGLYDAFLEYEFF